MSKERGKTQAALFADRREKGICNILAGKSPGPWARNQFPELDYVWRAVKPFARGGFPPPEALITDLLNDFAEAARNAREGN